MKDNELGIYIHIPFCKQKCYYCDFVSFSGQNEKMGEYIRCLEKELESYDLSTYNVTTIYIGGGTPSYLESKMIVDFLVKLKQKLQGNNTPFEKMEITIEVNPGTVTMEKLQDYKNVGINRLSIGLQSTNDKLLKQIGRIHTYQEFLNTYKMANKVGFKNINVDLMLGLPNQSIKDLKNSIEQVNLLQPNHISVYSLIVEEGTKLKKLIDEGKLTLLDEELERQMYWYVKNKLEQDGYNHYEISNFAKKVKESKHNQNCWKQKQYIGLGLAAHSYVSEIRYSNTENLETYLQNIHDGKLEKNRIIQERQNLEDTQKEFMMLGLRMMEGISICDFKEKFGTNPLYLFRNELNRLVNEGLIEVDLDRIRLTNRGLDLANLVFEEFI